MPSYGIHPKTYEPDRQRVANVISQLSPDVAWEVKIEKLVKHRSLSQNALYHRWVGIIASETGNDHDGIHDYLKSMFLSCRFVRINDREYEVLPSTKALNTKEMAEYMEQVSAWAVSFLGLSLPHPSDQQYRS